MKTCVDWPALSQSTALFVVTKTMFLMPLASTKTVMMCGVITAGKIQRAINIMTYLLDGDELEKALTTVFNEYSTDVVVEKLAPAANSQRNESLNNVVGSKNPKIRFYGGSESNDFRIACGISQKNEGQEYVCQALEEINVAPGVHCKRYCELADKQSLQQKIRKSLVPYKRRRSQLKSKNLSSNAKKEEREGPTYQTGIGLNLDLSDSNTLYAQLSTLIKNLTTCQVKEYEKLVPPVTTRPTSPQITFQDSIKYQFVVFDTETTSTGKDAQICQIAAITKSGKCFNEYILPTCNITHHASLINKLSIKTINGHRTLLKDNNPVNSVSLEECLEKFGKFLSTSDTNSHTVLIGHNSTTFDTPTLLRCGGLAFKQRLSSQNLFFADSLRVSRKHRPRKPRPQTPDLENTDLENPDLENPDLENTDLENPDLENTDLENPDLENTDLENPDLENTDLENADLENADLENTDLENTETTNVSKIL